MLVGYDGYISTLTAPAAQGATTLAVADLSLCTTLGTNHTLLRVGDGTYFDTVRVNSCLNGVLQLAAPLAHAYPTGSCVRFVVSAAVVCELIAQGGCTMPTAAPAPVACPTPTFIAGATLPEFTINVNAQHAIAWSGTAPFTTQTLVKPAWMTVTVTGNVAVLSGTPTNETDRKFQFIVSNACGTTEMTSTVCYCQGAGI